MTFLGRWKGIQVIVVRVGCARRSSPWGSFLRFEFGTKIEEFCGLRSYGLGVSRCGASAALDALEAG